MSSGANRCTSLYTSSESVVHEMTMLLEALCTEDVLKDGGKPTINSQTQSLLGT